MSVSLGKVLGNLYFTCSWFSPQVTESKTKKVSRKGSTSSTSSSSSSSVVDPLSSVLDGTDPLSMFAATAEPAATVTLPTGVRLGAG